jgi:hypothetical protein
MAQNENEADLVIYTEKSGSVSIEVRIETGSVWLNTHQMAELFQVDRTGIVRHIQNIYRTKELSKAATCAKNAQVANSSDRIWASNILKDYLIKGYSINEKRLNLYY